MSNDFESSIYSELKPLIYEVISDLGGNITNMRSGIDNAPVRRVAVNFAVMKDIDCAMLNAKLTSAMHRFGTGLVTIDGSTHSSADVKITCPEMTPCDWITFDMYDGTDMSSIVSRLDAPFIAIRDCRKLPFTPGRISALGDLQNLQQVSMNLILDQNDKISDRVIGLDEAITRVIEIVNNNISNKPAMIKSLIKAGYKSWL